MLESWAFFALYTKRGQRDSVGGVYNDVQRCQSRQCKTETVICALLVVSDHVGDAIKVRGEYLRLHEDGDGAIAMIPYVQRKVCATRPEEARLEEGQRHIRGDVGPYRWGEDCHKIPVPTYRQHRGQLEGPFKYCAS